jgi:hypothetical protein
MRSILLLLGFFAGVAVPAGLFLYHFVPSSMNNEQVQWLIGGLVIVPVLVAFIGGVALFFQTQTYHYIPLPGEDDERDDEENMHLPSSTKQSVVREHSPLESFIRARVLAVCEDVEAAVIHQPLIYQTTVYTQFSAYLQQQQEFLRAGWTMQFGLRITEPHQLRLVYEFSDDEFLAECEGIFDCVASYGAVQHSVPLTTEEMGQAAVEPHLAPPLIGMPGVMRLRLKRFEAGGPWLITGLYDTVRGLQMGEPVV